MVPPFLLICNQIFTIMHTFKCSNFQMNLCTSTVRHINQISQTYQIPILLLWSYYQLYQYGGWRIDQAMPGCTIKPKSALMYQSIPYSYILEPLHLCISESSASKIKTYSVNFAFFPLCQTIWIKFTFDPSQMVTSHVICLFCISITFFSSFVWFCRWTRFQYLYQI